MLNRKLLVLLAFLVPCVLYASENKSASILDQIISGNRENALKMARKKALTLDVQVAEQEIKLARLKHSNTQTSKQRLIGIDGVDNILYAHFIDQNGNSVVCKENDILDDGYQIVHIASNRVMLKKGARKRLLRVSPGQIQVPDNDMGGDWSRVPIRLPVNDLNNASHR